MKAMWCHLQRVRFNFRWVIYRHSARWLPESTGQYWATAVPSETAVTQFDLSWSDKHFLFLSWKFPSSLVFFHWTEPCSSAHVLIMVHRNTERQRKSRNFYWLETITIYLLPILQVRASGKAQLGRLHFCPTLCWLNSRASYRQAAAGLFFLAWGVCLTVAWGCPSRCLSPPPNARAGTPFLFALHLLMYSWPNKVMEWILESLRNGIAQGEVSH